MRFINKKERDEFSDKAAASIASAILWWQHKAATWLCNCDRRLLPKQRKLLYASIGIVAIVYLAIILSRALIAPQPHAIKAQWLKALEDTSHFPSGKSPAFIPFHDYKQKKKHFSY